MWAAVWGDLNTTYVNFVVSNMIRKYGSNYEATVNTLIPQRLASWGFAGEGKWAPIASNMPNMPVLYHSAVQNAVSDGNPDTFDPSAVAQLKTTLASQIGSNVTKDPSIGGISCRLMSDSVASRTAADRGKYLKRLGKR